MQSNGLRKKEIGLGSLVMTESASGLAKSGKSMTHKKLNFESSNSGRSPRWPRRAPMKLRNLREVGQIRPVRMELKVL